MHALGAPSRLGTLLGVADDSIRAMRPFWMHQVVEYVIGIVLISAGSQSPEPAVPAILGAIVLVNAAISIGPAGAFRLVPRKVHRVIDLFVIGLILFGAVQPFWSVDNSTRLVMAAVAIVLLFVWWHTDFATKEQRKVRRRSTARPTSEEIGRKAGRMAGDGVNAAKRMTNRGKTSDGS